MLGGLQEPLNGFMNAEVDKLLDHLEAELEGKEFLVAGKFTGRGYQPALYAGGPLGNGAAGGAVRTAKAILSGFVQGMGTRRRLELGGPVLLPRPSRDLREPDSTS